MINAKNIRVDSISCQNWHAKLDAVCTLRKIVKKGQGAYFSSGSRPNQTGHSWGRARLASAITGGKAEEGYKILEEGCKKQAKHCD